MESIFFKCQKCTILLEVSINSVGKKVKCVACKNCVVVPRPNRRWIPYSAFSKELTSKLEEITRRQGATSDVFIFTMYKETISGKLVWALVGVGILLAITWWTILGPPGDPSRLSEFVFIFSVSAVGCFLVTLNLTRLLALICSKIKPSIIITPVLLIETGLDGEAGEFFYMKGISKLTTTHHYQNSTKTNNSLEFYIDKERVQYWLPISAPTAVFTEFVNQIPQHFFTKEDRQSYDWIRNIPYSVTTTTTGKQIFWIVLRWGSACLTTLIFFYWLTSQIGFWDKLHYFLDKWF